MNAKLKVRTLLAQGLTGCQIVNQMKAEHYGIEETFTGLFWANFVVFMQPFKSEDKEIVLHVSNKPVKGMLETISSYPLETPACIMWPIT